MTNDEWEAYHKIRYDSTPVKFSVDFEMPRCYAQCFIAMLDEMVKNGVNGHSAWIGFYADGDGCFRPKYKVTKTTADITPTKEFQPIENVECELGWDGGD